MARTSKSGGVLAWEVVGILFIIGLGSLLHFIYEWSDYSPIVGLFSAVNESVWEHLKLGFWSLALYSLLEYCFIRRRINNFFIAKAAGILSLQVLIIAVFYGYTAFTGREILALDIGSYVAGAVICQMISYRILTRLGLTRAVDVLGVAFLAFHAVILMVFTFAPPKLPIFRDSNTGQYGTKWRVERRIQEENLHGY